MPLPLTNIGQDDMYNEALVMHAKAFAAFKANQLNAALKLFTEGSKWGTPLFFEHLGDVFFLQIIIWKRKMLTKNHWNWVTQEKVCP